MYFLLLLFLYLHTLVIVFVALILNVFRTKVKFSFSTRLLAFWRRFDSISRIQKRVCAPTRVHRCDFHVAVLS